ncbi:hypothetical protein HYZ80_01960 [Candidatus Parcubacteria bacterium]|nr:hypothetical protein [Candidatus Parcubacteria bacterium]
MKTLQRTTFGASLVGIEIATILILFQPTASFAQTCNCNSGRTGITAPPGQTCEQVCQSEGGVVGSGAGGSVTIPNFLGFNTIQAVINAVIPKLIILATVIVAPMVIWAAYMLMFSPASPDLINKAKTTLLWTLVGYAIILVGSGIAYIVSEILGVPTG